MKERKLKKQLKRIAKMNMAVGILAVAMLVSESSLAISENNQIKNDKLTFNECSIDGDQMIVNTNAYIQAFAQWNEILNDPDTKQPKQNKNTFTVTSNGDNGAGTLRQAITNANTNPGNDNIVFDMGNNIITLNSTLPQITESVSIDGSNISGDDINIVGGGNGSNFRAFDLSINNHTVSFNDLHISSFEFTNSNEGPAIMKWNGTLTLTDCTISNCKANSGHGGAIRNANGELNISNCNISNNSAQNDGGAILNRGTLNLQNSTISSNSASSGGAIANSGTCNINQSTLSNNTASSNGGGIATSGVLTMEECTINNNSASWGGEDLNAGYGSYTYFNGNNSIDDSYIGSYAYNNGSLVSKNVEIASGYGNGYIGNNPGATFTISSGGTFDLGSFNNKTGATFTLEPGASMKDDENFNNNGTTNIKFEVSENIWHLISSPLPSATSDLFVGDYLQIWSESDQIWQEITPTDEFLIPVKGYGLWATPGKSDHTYTFTGTPNTGTKNIALTDVGSGTSDGFNCIGNPYPSSIDWGMLDNTYGAAHFWNGTAYVDWNNGSGSGTQHIAPMQGFFIEALGETNFSVSNSNRTHEGADSYLKSTESSIENGVVLFADNGSYKDELWLLLHDEQSEGFDIETDASKLLSNTEGLSQIWSISSDKKLSIDARPYQQRIQLGFKNDVNGNYQIGINLMDGINSIELEDTKLNNFHNLSNGTYSFDWKNTDSEERFILHLKATATAELEEQEAQVYAANGQIYIRLDQPEGYEQLQLIDLSGRLIAKYPLQQQNLQNFDISHLRGAYLVQLITSNETIVQKIILK